MRSRRVSVRRETEMNVRYTTKHPSVIHQTIDDETIVIDLATGTYYSLRDTAAQVWSGLAEGETQDAIVQRLEHAYEGQRDAIENAVGDFLDELVAEGLVSRSENGAVAATSSPYPNGATRLPFVPPQLEKYTDMQDIILLDPVHTVDNRGWPYAAEADNT